jgi:hypothetical protein
MASWRSWASSSGLPTRHATDAAIIVARIIGSNQARVADTRESYWRSAAGGVLSPADLKIGTELLVACGLAYQDDDHFMITGQCIGLLAASRDELTAVMCLRAIAGRNDLDLADSELMGEVSNLVQDSALQEHLLRSMTSLYDASHLAEVGAIGEVLVLSQVKLQLTALGHQSLADNARWVSQLDDSAGYDIAAPYIGGGERLLEVKSTTAHGEVVTVHLSRNEADEGLKEPDWLLVVCRVLSIEDRSGVVMGWLTVNDVRSHFPVDSVGGKWESVAIAVHVCDLVPGIPGSAR